MSREVEGRTCAGCGGVIARVPKRGPLPTYCSSGCRWKVGHQRDADRRANRRIGLACEACGAALGEVSRRNRFCSTACSQRKRREVANAVP